jgi:hypothetical protein
MEIDKLVYPVSTDAWKNRGIVAGSKVIFKSATRRRIGSWLIDDTIFHELFYVTVLLVFNQSVTAIPTTALLHLLKKRARFNGSYQWIDAICHLELLQYAKWHAFACLLLTKLGSDIPSIQKHLVRAVVALSEAPFGGGGSFAGMAAINAAVFYCKFQEGGATATRSQGSQPKMYFHS